MCDIIEHSVRMPLGTLSPLVAVFYVRCEHIDIHVEELLAWFWHQ